MRPRLAPRMWRVASSFIRTLERTSTRLVTFTAPMSSTKSAPPHSRYSTARTFRTRSSWNGTA